jgi:hypothetical protein
MKDAVGLGGKWKKKGRRKESLKHFMGATTGNLVALKETTANPLKE